MDLASDEEIERADTIKSNAESLIGENSLKADPVSIKVNNEFDSKPLVVFEDWLT